MVVFKRKQVVFLSLVLMIIVAGYLQYSYNKSSIATAGKDSGKIGEAVYVDGSETYLQDETVNAEVMAENIIVSASKQANDFFAQAKLDKEVERSKDTDILKEISEDINAEKEVKTQAYEQMIKLVDNAEKEMRIETLIKEKGFADVIALFGDDGSIDIIVKAPDLTTAQTAQIADIISRQADMDIGNIHIKNLY